LISSFKIELCSIDSLNSLNECVLASEQISIYEISNYLKDDEQYFPTYGPRYIDFYNNSEKLKLKKKLQSSVDDITSILDETNLAHNNSISYVARLFFSIDSKDLNETSVENKTVSMQTKIKNEFIAFFIIDEVTMIDPIYKDAFISFQLCVGINNILLRLSNINLYIVYE
jgi:hypothetical protein